MLPRKLALIHSFSGFGHSTMSVILPIVSAMGVQGCPLPTAVFSNHTGFSEWYKADFTEHMLPYMEAWEHLNLKFDGIYSGYLGSGVQCDALLSFVQTHPEATYFLDPVMGDHGKLYRAITAEHVSAMKTLTAHAQYIFPNITEACVLTDTPYNDSFTRNELCKIMQKLHAMGPAHIVITGIREPGSSNDVNGLREPGSSNIFVNYISEQPASAPASFTYAAECAHTYESTHAGEFAHAAEFAHADACAAVNIPTDIQRIACPAAGASRPGTGDIFGAVAISSILKGMSLQSSVQKAAHFVYDCIRASDENSLPVCEGTCFELVLPKLMCQE